MMNVRLEKEELNCVRCKNVLINFPIRACSNGGIICGKCYPPDKQCTLIRIPWLENILRKASFRCKFNENGCNEELSFVFVKEHEGKCLYQSVNCLWETCNWNGLMIDLHKHFDDIHPDSVLCIPDSNDGTLLTVTLKENIADVQLVLVEDVLFVVEYNYANSKRLSYQIAYVSMNIQQATFTIVSCNETLREGTPESYNSAYKNLETITVPKGCTIAIKVAYTKYKWCTLDYAKLNLLVCVICGGFLIPFAYDWQQPSGLICGFCAETNHINFISKQQNINFLIESTNFSCKWKYCNFVSGAINMFNHQKTCRFQIYTCEICSTKQKGDFDFIKSHLENLHNCNYIMDEQPFLVPSSPNIPSLILTLKYGTIIILKLYHCGTRVYNDPCGINASITTIGSNNKFHVTIRFEHDNCRIKSKWFSVTTSSWFRLEELPLCLRTNRALFATIKIS